MIRGRDLTAARCEPPWATLGPAVLSSSIREQKEARGGSWDAKGAARRTKRQEERQANPSFPPMIPSNLHASRLGPVAISIRRWLPEGIAYNTIYYGGPPARRNLNRADAMPP